MSSPAAELTEPQPQELIPDLVNQFLSFPDLVSPTHWMLWAIEKVCGVNPGEWLAEEFTGDWESVSKAGSALSNLANFDNTFTKNLDDGVHGMLDNWHSNAAFACSQYFNKVSGALKEQVSALDEVAKEFQTLAQGIKSTASAIMGGLETLVDWLLAAALEAAAAAASSWTIVGGILGGAAAAFSITKAMGAWGKIVEMHGHAWNVAQGFVGLCAGYMGALRGMENHPPPAGAYNHPGA
ncbi:MAG: hypothetical protein GEV03_14595 [Streptosporangiales bacterium]|nr:hypothetical protein [Streptosporangiales bacterium]